MLLLLIMGSHASRCEPTAFVFGVTIVIELSCVTQQVLISLWGRSEMRRQTSMSSRNDELYFVKRYKSNGMLKMSQEHDTVRAHSGLPLM